MSRWERRLKAVTMAEKDTGGEIRTRVYEEQIKQIDRMRR